MLNILHRFKQQHERGRLIRQLAPAQDEQTTQLLAQEAAFNRQVAIVALTGATAVIHITLGTQLFVLNGLGYLALLGAHLVAPERESYRNYTRKALFGYTGVTVIGYFALRGVSGFADPTGILNKLIELGLMSVLWEDLGSAEVPMTELSEYEINEVVQQIPIETVSQELAPA